MTDSHVGRADTPLQSQFLQDRVAIGDMDTIVSVARAACQDIHTETWSELYIQSPLTEYVSALQGAPAAMIFTSARLMSNYEWLEFGMFLQSLKLAAQPLGLAVRTVSDMEPCETSLRELVRIPRATLLLSAAAVGYLDPNCPGESTDNRLPPVTIRFLS